MIERRRREVDRTFAEAPYLCHSIEDWQLLGRWSFGQRPQNALWPACRTRRIEHGGTEGLICDRRIGKSAHRLVKIEDRGPIAWAVDDKAAIDPRAPRHRLQCYILLGHRGDQNLRLAVVEDVGQLVWRQVRVDASVIEARPFAGAAAFDVAGVVLHEYGVVVEPAEAARA